MNGVKWSPEEKALLKTDLTAEEISVKIGRTVEAVKRARYTYTGHMLQKGGRWLETNEERLFEAERQYHKLKREENLINLCKILGVRIGGMYDRTV